MQHISPSVETVTPTIVFYRPASIDYTTLTLWEAREKEEEKEARDMIFKVPSNPVTDRHSAVLLQAQLIQTLNQHHASASCSCYLNLGV